MEKKTSIWKLEQSRIDNIIELIRTKRTGLEENTGQLKENIIDLRKNFWEDVTVNIDEPDEVIETYASIKQQAELLSERERSHGQFYKSIKLYNRLEDSPYFARIDFTEDGGKKETVYIGIGSLMDKKEDDFLIYDWRAPISSMYYDYSPGAAEYETPEGKIKGEMDLKRQFLIRKGKITGLFDTGITIGDTLLQQVLGGNASSQMKSIVATIQKEQNRIIRYEKDKMLVVQGVAGSGKTSAAMQRIAYLLYRYRKTIRADQVLLFSPNQMFISYVSSVLPELGEENMRQNTFQEYAAQRLDDEYKLETPFEQLEYLLTSREDGADARIDGIHFKAGLEFKHLIDEYVKELAKKGMHFRNIKFRGERIVAANEINNYFYQLDAAMSIPNKIEQVMEWLLEKVKELEKREIDKDWPVEEAAFMDKKDYLDAYKSLQKNQQFNEETFDDYQREEELLTRVVVERSLRPLRKKIKKLKFIHLRKIYQGLYEHDLPFSYPDNWKQIGEKSIAALQSNILYAEDITPYLYLQDQIEGRKINPVIQYVFIDEAQDYSPFQFEFIRQLFPNAHFTLLGDYNQAILANVGESPTILEAAGGYEHVERMKLMRSYRSTKPIVEFTSRIVPGGHEIEAFNRDGTLPRIHLADSEPSQFDQIKTTIRERQQEGQETIAILGRTKEECQHIVSSLQDEFSPRYIYKESQTFEKGLMVLPVYLAKGIEFDSVIIPDASAATYYRENERKLFYTACTRAMHELDICYRGEMSPFLKQIPSELYE
ncbi:helicase IV [Thalassobacillus devorans]|uniref:Helicase IV n=1 Tax=Thalassobacillus devorans TaxID=279813 RepID=A0ABQ1PGI7_9BACI|nr:RNA polymerase recycling motor HelD [Thalassobacillus devorans]NIK29462.1 DNA helicase-2/ATP-dependent DNA helicase PcrA [Thalassobacillus devorans]GGC96877.1 helicase IV [Thalassobacillus devorans]